MNANECGPRIDANEREFLNELIKTVIGAIYEVANTLGAGFLEKVYERALLAELRHRGLHAESQVPVSITYKGTQVGEYYADILVEGKLLVELKCAASLGDEHMAQTLNYLKAAGLNIALLVNFQHPRVEWKRVVRNF